MHKLVVLYKPPTDPDHFRDYYTNTHIPLARKLPNLLSYRYSFEVAAADGESPYFAIFEGDFADAETMAASLASPEGEAALGDIPNYATGGVVALNYPITAGDTLS